MQVRIEPSTEIFTNEELLAIGLRLGHMRPAKRKEIKEELNVIVDDAIKAYRTSVSSDVKRLLGKADSE